MIKNFKAFIINDDVLSLFISFSIMTLNMNKNISKKVKIYQIKSSLKYIYFKFFINIIY